MPPKVRRDLAEGDRIGPYVVDMRLGEGGMAEVFAGHHTQTGVRVALKRSLVDPDTQHIRLPMFQREARIACKLLHPNIVTTYELVLDDHGNPVLVMELLEGVSVKEVGPYFRKTIGGLRLAVELVHAAARALDYLHEQQDPESRSRTGSGLIHRDVAPDNLMVTFSGSVKLLDFGLAKDADDARLTRAGILKGKAAYMSPEQAQGHELDARTDQYALGITAYWLLTGVLPFERENVPKTLIAVMQDPLAPASQHNRMLPRRVDAVLARAVARERTNRFATCGAFAMALDEALADAEAPVANVTLAALAREAAEQQKPTIVIPGARPNPIGAHGSDGGLDVPTDPQGLSRPSRSDEERTVVEPAPRRFSTSPEATNPAASSDEHTRKEPAPVAPMVRARKPTAVELPAAPGARGAPPPAPAPSDDGLEPLFTMPMSLPSGLHPAPPPSSLGPVLAGLSLAVVIAGVGVLFLLLPDVLATKPKPPAAQPDAGALWDAGAASADDGSAAPPPRAAPDAGVEPLAPPPTPTPPPTAPLPSPEAASTPAPTSERPSRGSRPALAPTPQPTPQPAPQPTPEPRTLRLRAPPHVEWRGPDGVLARGSGSVLLPGTQDSIAAIDTELDVTTLVPLPEDVDTLDYAALPRTEVQILVRPWAEVTLGNRSLGLTPLKPLRLVAGRYKLTLKHDQLTQTHEIVVGGSERIDLRYRF